MEHIVIIHKSKKAREIFAKKNLFCWNYRGNFIYDEIAGTIFESKDMRVLKKLFNNLSDTRKEMV